MHIAHIALALALLTTPLALAPPPASAAPARHCVITIVGQHPNGELITTPPRCYATREEVARTRQTRSATASLELVVTLAVHYDGASKTLGSLTVDGEGCVGGYINLSSYSWVDKISSTDNVWCSRTRHWTGATMSGTSEDVVGDWENLESINNLADSVQYVS
ncbi:MAG TPA: hypothetical protein VF230_04970 [Acidimicrobiales bacterium]